MDNSDQREVEGHEEREFDCAQHVQEELERILNSASFQGTPKRREMLKFLIEETLAGRANTLKGYTIGVSVFEREDNFDSQADPIVRLEARRLRQDLDSYYISEGAGNPIRISIPKGQYAPRFHNQHEEREDRLDQFQSENASDEIGPDIPADGTETEPVGKIRLSWLLAAAACSLVLLAAGVLFGIQLLSPQALKFDTARPSVTVLPFTVSSKDPGQDVLATGIADQIINELTRFPDIQIYLAEQGKTGPQPPDPARLMGPQKAAYLINGSVTTEGDFVRVNARLTQTASNRVLWSASYDRKLSQSTLLEIEEGIASDVASSIGLPYGAIKSELAKNLPAATDPSADSFECVLRGYVHRRSLSADLHAPIRQCLEKAVQVDSSYPEAWAMLGWIYLDEARFGNAKPGEKELYFDRALDSASHALTLDANNVFALKAMSAINHYMGNIAEGEKFAREALEKNPYDPDSLVQLGWRLAVVGNFEEGIPLIQKAIGRINNPPSWYFHLIAIDHMLNGRFAETLSAAKKGTIDGSGISWCLTAIAHAELGNKSAARTALHKMAETSPRLNRDPEAFFRVHQANDRITEAILAGLKKTGWVAPKDS